MEIIKYASKSCVKCKALDRVFKLVDLPCEVQTKYVEDEGELAFVKLDIGTMPTVIISNDYKQERLIGLFSPKQLEEAIQKVK